MHLFLQLPLSTTTNLSELFIHPAGGSEQESIGWLTHRTSVAVLEAWRVVMCDYAGRREQQTLEKLSQQELNYKVEVLTEYLKSRAIDMLQRHHSVTFSSSQPIATPVRTESCKDKTTSLFEKMRSTPCHSDDSQLKLSH
eukprot:2681641-Amphidinium_carterae.1